MHEREKSDMPIVPVKSSGTGESRGDRRVGVNYGSYISATIVDSEMHAYFTGHVP